MVDVRGVLWVYGWRNFFVIDVLENGLRYVRGGWGAVFVRDRG